MIRTAVPADAEALLSVYAQYIDTPITFEYELPSVAEFRRRILSTLEGYPYLVWEEDGFLLGYAYAHRYREREADRWGAELSVYVDRSAHSRGIGKALYAELIRLLREQGVSRVQELLPLRYERMSASAFTFYRASRA